MRRSGWIGVACLLAFLALALLVEAEGTLPAERRALIEVRDLVGSPPPAVLATLDSWSDPPGLSLLAAAAVLGLLAARRWGEAAWFVVTVSGVWLLNPALKELFARPRPDLWPSPVAVSEFGFPSGHAANTAALVGALVLALAPGRRRATAAAVGALALTVVAATQLALGVHYPSDLLGGWLWAGAWLAGAVTLRARIEVIHRGAAGTGRRQRPCG